MVDGEGGGLDRHGRQRFLLLRAGDHRLYTGEELTPEDMLEFILDLPPEPIYFWYSGGYDATMILRDLPDETLKKICNPPQGGYEYWLRYGIEWRAKHYLSVCRLDRDNKIIEGSIRTINEVFGFFQSSFFKACEGFEVATKTQLDELEKNKAARPEFEFITDEIEQYNRLECELGAKLMARLRELCYRAQIYPNTWRGAGSLATALHNQHATPKRADCHIPERVEQLAREAYYGGRFEITAHGRVGQKVYEYDIRSAYPNAMSSLPCLVHGRWHEIRRTFGRRSDTYIARIRFDNTISRLYALPIRLESGYLIWPKKGEGVYWSCELEHFKGKYEILEAWEFESKCSCNHFHWVEALYNERRTLSKMQGYPIKLGINSLYGKLAQRRPVEGAWTNFIWAGLITARTRARLQEIINRDPNSIIMCATDGIYSLKKLDLPLSADLGDWEETIYSDGLFIAQPGVYWSPDERRIKRKTRGLSAAEFERARDQLERQADRWDGSLPAPEASFKTTRFRGLKAATAQGNYAGVWSLSERILSMDYSIKRSRAFPEGALLRSTPHNDFYKSFTGETITPPEIAELHDDDLS